MDKIERKFNLTHAVVWPISSCLLMCVTDIATASSVGDGINMGEMASSIVGSFTALTRLITAGSYLAGLAFSIGAIMKFKQHKDNPTQIPIGTPIALVFIAATLLFLPTILGIAGFTMFGAGGGAVSGPTGAVFSGKTELLK